MNLKKVIGIYNVIKDRIPSTYPRPKLAFYEDEESMLINNKMEEIEDDDNVYACVNPNTLTINLPLNMSFKYYKEDGTEMPTRNIKLISMSEETIANTLFHEIGHLYAGNRYGYKSKQYHDEEYCDKFAARWVKKLIEEQLLEE